MSGAFLTSFRYAPGGKPISVKSRWGTPHLDQPGRSLRLLLGPASWMLENPSQLVDLRQESGPCTFVRIDGDFLVTIPQRYTVQAFCFSGMSMRGLPPLGRPLRDPGHVLPPSLCAGGIEPIAPDELEFLRWDVLRQLDQEV